MGRKTPQQYAAHKEVARAIRKGALKRPTEFDCTDCGEPAKVYDHRDYSKPLQVEPVCLRCNKLRGPAAGHVTYAPWGMRKLGIDIPSRIHAEAA